MAPMICGYASATGEVTDELIEHYERRSRGQVGLIIVEDTAIDYGHRADAAHLTIHHDSCIPSLTRLADRIKAHGARAFIQLSHAGPIPYESKRVIGPSTIRVREGPIPEELQTEEIDKIKGMYIDAANRAYEAGFDGIQVHAAHFCLLSAFLSSYTNRRDDEYGGSILKKAKLVVEIIREIRKELDVPIMCRVNGFENVVRGIDIQEAIEIAKILENAGVDFLDITGFLEPLFGAEDLIKFTSKTRPDFMKGFPYASYIPCAAAIKKNVGIPVSGVGQVRDETYVKRIFDENLCDMVEIGRGLLADPLFVKKILDDQGDSITPWTGMDSWIQ
jgi:2,4-dienoyl-CoA reductase-like NADH-dependent reductase (Old Yellow Enzyme family)